MSEFARDRRAVFCINAASRKEAGKLAMELAPDHAFEDRGEILNPDEYPVDAANDDNDDLAVGGWRVTVLRRGYCSPTGNEFAVDYHLEEIEGPQEPFVRPDAQSDSDRYRSVLEASCLDGGTKTVAGDRPRTRL